MNSKKIKKVLRMAVNVGCGFEGDAEDAAKLLSLIETNEARIAELEGENERYKKLLQDWVDIFDPRYTQDASLVSAVRLVMDKSMKERASDGRDEE